MNILAWIILGALAGWLASKLVRGHGLGLLGNIVVGVVGAFIGGFLVNLIGGVGITGFNVWSFVVAVIGAAILLWVVRLLSGERTTVPK
jgi:uncharacterized membrane protein YeaQ/YmgE (transglycosylase-associated protein family)